MKTGIIGFFDVLGYQSFLENNPDDGAHQVVSKLVGLRAALDVEMREAFSHYHEASKVDEMLGLVNPLTLTLDDSGRFQNND
jgi:hypothetical protein